MGGTMHGGVPGGVSPGGGISPGGGVGPRIHGGPGVRGGFDPGYRGGLHPRYGYRYPGHGYPRRYHRPGFAFYPYAFSYPYAVSPPYSYDCTRVIRVKARKGWRVRRVWVC